MSAAKEIEKLMDDLLALFDKHTKSIKILHGFFKDLSGRMLLVEKELKKIKEKVK